MHRKMCARTRLHFGEGLVAAHRFGRCHLLLRYAGADHVEPIERGFGGDLLLKPLELEAGLFDGERKVLADFVLIDDFADPHADLVAAGERAVLDAGTDFLQFLLRRLQQCLALIPTQIALIQVATVPASPASDTEPASWRSTTSASAENVFVALAKLMTASECPAPWS